MTALANDNPHVTRVMLRLTNRSLRDGHVLCYLPADLLKSRIWKPKQRSPVMLVLANESLGKKSRVKPGLARHVLLEASSPLYWAWPCFYFSCLDPVILYRCVLKKGKKEESSGTGMLNCL